MWWYVAKRLLQTIPVFLGATLILFILLKLRPGDPILNLAGNKPVSQEVRDALAAQYHLDDPLFVQWFQFAKNALTFNFGETFAGQPVFDLIKQTFPVTVVLAFMALAIDAVLGIALGTIAGLRRNGWFDSSVLVVSLLLISIPIFVLGFVMQLVFGVKLGWTSPTVGGDWTVGDLILPAIVLAIANFAYTIRLTRTSVAENLTRRPCAHGACQGVARAFGHPKPRPAQLFGPGRHLHRHQPGFADGGCDHHRDHFQRSRHRQRRLLRDCEG